MSWYSWRTIMLYYEILDSMQSHAFDEAAVLEF